MSSNPDSPEPISCTPVEFSAASGSVESSQSSAARDNASAQAPAGSSKESAGPFTCSICKRVLKTFRGYTEHSARHRITEANQRRPDILSLGSEVPSLMEKILRDISNESGGERKKFIDKLLAENVAESEEWAEFCLDVAQPILELTCARTKLLPQNQHEEILHKLNIQLNNVEYMNAVVNTLKSVCSEPLSDILSRRLVFRVSTKLLDALQLSIAKSMRISTRREENPKDEMNEDEEKAFVVKIGDLLRSIVKKNSQSSSSALQRQCACLKDKFADCNIVVSTDMFLDKKNWFSGDEESIVLSDNCLIFFKVLDSISRKLSSPEKQVDSEAAIKELHKNFPALDGWFNLTQNHFNEDDSLDFMKSLVSVFVRRVFYHFSERQSTRQIDKAVRATEAALRTHLHTNLTANDD